MQWKKNKWRLLIAFFAGVLICFITTRFHYFEIKKELDVPGLVIGALGLIIGLYIADTIQKRINRNQNRYSYLESKIDICWTEFTNIAKVITISDNIAVESIARLNTEVIHQVGFIKNIFEAFDIEASCIASLDNKLENFESLFDDIPTQENVKYYSEQKDVIENNIVLINQCFSEVLKAIQDIE
jgi:uncharacterized membrane protein|tara:strand:+ start:9273 stop:9827 length:555 start_codon:yes stop_codon:yes gene_type:complete